MEAVFFPFRGNRRKVTWVLGVGNLRPGRQFVHLSDGGPQKLSIYVTANEEALPKISHSDQETELPTPLADHCVLAESNGLGTFFGSGDLG